MLAARTASRSASRNGSSVRSSPTPSAPASSARRASVGDDDVGEQGDLDAVGGAWRAARARPRSSSADGSPGAGADRRRGRVVRRDHDVAGVAVDQDRHAVGGVDHGRVHPDHERYAERAGHDRRVRAGAAEHRDRAGQLTGVRQQVRGGHLVREQDERPGGRGGRDPAGELGRRPSARPGGCRRPAPAGRPRPALPSPPRAVRRPGSRLAGGDGVRAGRAARRPPRRTRGRGRSAPRRPGCRRTTVAPSPRQRAGQLVEARRGRVEGRPDLGRRWR